MLLGSAGQIRRWSKAPTSLHKGKSVLSCSQPLFALPLQATWSRLRNEYLALTPAQLHHLLSNYYLGLGRPYPEAWSPLPEEQDKIASSECPQPTAAAWPCCAPHAHPTASPPPPPQTPSPVLPVLPLSTPQPPHWALLYSCSQLTLPAQLWDPQHPPGPGMPPSPGLQPSSLALFVPSPSDLLPPYSGPGLLPALLVPFTPTLQPPLSCPGIIDLFSPAGDIFESFTEHPPLILPIEGFRLRLSEPVGDDALHRQLCRMRRLVWDLEQEALPANQRAGYALEGTP